MKTLISNISNGFLIFFISLLLFTNCKKTPDEFDGKATAVKNGIEWNAECVSGFSNQYPDELFIDMTTFSDEGFRRESFGVSRIIPEVGKYAIVRPIRDSVGMVIVNNWSSYATLTDDGDVIGDFYKVLETEENTIEISSVNLETMTISGKFNISYVNSDTLSVIDTIRFVNGEFQAQIKEN